MKKKFQGYQFKKGDSGNPNGRPKKIPALEELFLKVMTETDTTGQDKVETLIRKLLEKAQRGDLKAIEYLLNRMYGKPREFVSTEHPSEVVVRFQG